MKKMTVRLALVLGALCLTSSMGMAATLNCASGSIVNVATQLGPGGDNCNLAGATNVLFSNFTVQLTGFTSAIVGIQNTSNVSNGDANLNFQLAYGGGSAASAFGDVFLQYEVTGGITGIDIDLQATPLNPGGFMQIVETACSVAFVNQTCGGTTLGQLAVTSINGAAAHGSLFFTPAGSASPVFIKKDILFAGATATEFNNSHILSAVPEPMTLSMMGVGLVGLSLISRRRKKS